MDYVEPSTSSAAITQPAAAEAAPTESNDGQETPTRPEEEEKREVDPEQVIEEVPKKSSSIRFRKKPKQPKQQRSKGVWFHYVCTHNTASHSIKVYYIQGAGFEYAKATYWHTGEKVSSLF